MKASWLVWVVLVTGCYCLVEASWLFLLVVLVAVVGWWRLVGWFWWWRWWLLWVGGGWLVLVVLVADYCFALLCFVLLCLPILSVSFLFLVESNTSFLFLALVTLGVALLEGSCNAMTFPPGIFSKRDS